jgi:response regulator RpfG family c-di-GMP phosphodiesterase
MLLADLHINSIAHVGIARRKIYDSFMLLNKDVAFSSKSTSDFSELARHFVQTENKLKVHVSLKRNGQGRALHLDFVSPLKPAFSGAFAQQNGEGWLVERSYPVSDNWVDQQILNQVREIFLLKSREELLTQNNDLLRKTMHERTDSLNRLATEFGNIQDIDTLLTRLLEEVLGVFHCDAGSILMKEDGMLCFRHAVTNNSDSTDKMLVSNSTPVRLPIDRNSMAGAAALDGLLVVKDAYNIPATATYKFNSTFDNLTGFKTRAVTSVALRSGQNELLGVLQLINPHDAETREHTEFSEDDQKLAVHFAGLASMAIERSSMTRTLVLRMMRLAEMRDPKETGAHVRRVSHVATRLYVAWAKRRGLSQELIYKQLDHLRLAAMLHDVGKVGIDDAILKKNGRLDPDERRKMETHAHIGAASLQGQKISLDDAIRDVTLYHHARWDGTGYPSHEQIVKTLEQLGEDTSNVPQPKGEGIPINARLVAIADVFDALMSRRAYKEAWAPEQVREEIARCAGTHFDPELVELFISDFDEYNKIHSALQE